MRIILTRHGETEENKAGITQGQSIGGKLSSEGIIQAKALGEKLKDIHIDIIFTSDLKRCKDTAQEIAKYHPNAKFIPDQRLRERNMGEFEGKLRGENDWDALPGNIFTNKPSGGESFQEMWKRIESFYKELIMLDKNTNILVVGHGGSIFMLHGLICQKDLEYSVNKIERLKNTAVSEFEIRPDGKYTTILVNSQEHLKK